MDFFTVLDMTTSFIRIAPFIASFKEYTIPFLDHLFNYKIFHIEKDIRILAAKSFALISLINPNYVIDNYFMSLIEMSEDKYVHKRHGAIISLSSIIFAFSGNADIMLCDQQKK